MFDNPLANVRQTFDKCSTNVLTDLRQIYDGQQVNGPPSQTLLIIPLVLICTGIKYVNFRRSQDTIPPPPAPPFRHLRGWPEGNQKNKRPPSLKRKKMQVRAGGQNKNEQSGLGSGFGSDVGPGLKPELRATLGTELGPRVGTIGNRFGT